MGYCNDKSKVVNREYVLKKGRLLRIASVDSRNTDGFGAWVRDIRTTNNLSQAELAQRMSVASTYVSRVETGDRPPTADFCIAFAIALDLTIESVLERAGIIEPQPEPSGVEVKRFRELFEAGYTQLDTDEREAVLLMVKSLYLTKAKKAGRQR